jgi:hypothetical protein
LYQLTNARARLGLEEGIFGFTRHAALHRRPTALATQNVQLSTIWVERAGTQCGGRMRQG